MHYKKTIICANTCRNGLDIDESKLDFLVNYTRTSTIKNIFLQEYGLIFEP